MNEPEIDFCPTCGTALGYKDSASAAVGLLQVKRPDAPEMKREKLKYTEEELQEATTALKKYLSDELLACLRSEEEGKQNQKRRTKCSINKAMSSLRRSLKSKERN